MIRAVILIGEGCAVAVDDWHGERFGTTAHNDAARL
jgi:hypothetical protein